MGLIMSCTYFSSSLTFSAMNTRQLIFLLLLLASCCIPVLYCRGVIRSSARIRFIWALSYLIWNMQEDGLMYLIKLRLTRFIITEVIKLNRKNHNIALVAWFWCLEIKEVGETWSNNNCTLLYCSTALWPLWLSSPGR